MTARPRVGARPGPGLDLQHQRLLRAAFATRRGDVEAAWRAWHAAGGDVRSADDASIRLMPLVGQSLARHGLEHVELGRLRGLQRRGFVERARLVQVVGSWIAALADDGVPVIITGAIASQRGHGELAPRAGHDSGLLVRPRDVARATRRLRALGLAPVGTHPPTLARALRGDANLADEGWTTELAWVERGGTSITLRWALLPTNAGPTSDARIWACAVPAGGALAGRALTPTHALLVALVRLALGDLASDRAADALAILASGEPIDWRLLDSETRARRVEALARAGLEACRAIVGADDATGFAGPAAVLGGLWSEPARPLAATIFTARWDVAAALGPHLEGRSPGDAARVVARAALHHVAATRTGETLLALTRPARRALLGLRTR